MWYIKVTVIFESDLHQAQSGHIIPYPAKLIYLNFHPLDVVSRYRDPQLQVGENYWYWFSLRSILLSMQIVMFNPCPAELLQLYFSSFEAGIANAISSFKWRKINITIYEK